MKIINEPKPIELDDSYKSSDGDSLIPDNFYESKSSIFDDDFQGIEWPVKKHRPGLYYDDPFTGADTAGMPGNIFFNDND